MDYYSQIHWVDEYIKNVAPYIYVRQEDNLLIKIPNQVYKLNPQGVKILRHLLEGGSVYGIIDKQFDKESAACDMHNFFCDMRAVLKGCYHERESRLAVEKIPFSLGFNTLPVLSEIAVTYRCNLSCKFCYAACGCKKIAFGDKFLSPLLTKKRFSVVSRHLYPFLYHKKDSSAGELSKESLQEVLSIIKNEAEVPSVSFTGGEPTLRADLPELIRYAKSLKMWVNLITNATLITKDLAGVLKGAGLDSAQVSLEAADGRLHDDIVESPGAFLRTMEGLKNLREAGIRVHTNTTISRLNKDNLNETLTLIKSLGLDKFSMNMLMPAGNALKNLQEILITYEEIGDIVLSVHSNAEKLGLEFMWYSPTPMCIFNPIVHGLGNKGCAACDGLLSIAPNGDILPCSSYPKAMANILKIKGRFKRVWRSAAFAFFQKKKFAHRHCKSCRSLDVCNGACPLYWKHLGYKELQEVMA